MLAQVAQPPALVGRMVVPGVSLISRWERVAHAWPEISRAVQGRFAVTISAEWTADAKAYAQNVANFARSFYSLSMVVYNQSQVLPAGDGVTPPTVSYTIQATSQGRKSRAITLYRGHDFSLDEAQSERIARKASLLFNRLRSLSDGQAQVKLIGTVRAAIASIPEGP